jgi:hypothetical protein
MSYTEEGVLREPDQKDVEKTWDPAVAWGVGHQAKGSQLLPVSILSCDGTSGDPELETAVAKVMEEAFALWKARHKKYGRLNISMTGKVGCVVRAGDKVARLVEAWVNRQGEDSQDESVEDSCLDLTNYGIMALLCHRKLWPS